jgi:hypothetical protein
LLLDDGLTCCTLAFVATNYRAHPITLSMTHQSSISRGISFSPKSVKKLFIAMASNQLRARALVAFEETDDGLPMQFLEHRHRIPSLNLERASTVMAMVSTRTSTIILMRENANARRYARRVWRATHELGDAATS